MDAFADENLPDTVTDMDLLDAGADKAIVDTFVEKDLPDSGVVKDQADTDVDKDLVDAGADKDLRVRILLCLSSQDWVMRSSQNVPMYSVRFVVIFVITHRQVQSIHRIPQVPHKAVA